MTFKSTLVIALCLSFLFAGGWYWQTQTRVKVPDVSFTTIKGQTIKSTDLRGQLALVTFWATDCPGCIEEIPHLIDWHRQFADRGLSIVAVAMHYDPPNHVLAMADSKQLPYAIALDPNGSLAQAFGNVQLTPTTFLLDRDGNIILHKIGVLDPAIIQDKLRDQGLSQ